MNSLGRIFVATVTVIAALSSPGRADDFDRAVRIDEVRRAELAFAATVAEDRPRVFAAMLDDAAVFVSGSAVTRGKEAIVAAWQGFFGPDRPRMTWQPEIVEISADGELGFTRGPWRLRGVGEDGKPFERGGVFNSVWQRQQDGGWKIVFDAGCAACPRCE
jgi:ketosteroid isomerase-like protein